MNMGPKGHLKNDESIAAESIIDSPSIVGKPGGYDPRGSKQVPAGVVCEEEPVVDMTKKKVQGSAKPKPPADKKPAAASSKKRKEDTIVLTDKKKKKEDSGGCC
jgi:hypothetical protein